MAVLQRFQDLDLHCRVEAEARRVASWAGAARTPIRMHGIPMLAARAGRQDRDFP